MTFCSSLGICPVWPIDTVNTGVNNAITPRREHVWLGEPLLATRVEYQGCIKSIELLVDDDGNCPTYVFLEKLSTSDRRKVDHLFQLMGEKGQIKNKQRFKKLEGTDGIFEFKSHQIRLLCFFAGNKVVICRGVRKKKDLHDEQDIRFATECKRGFTGG